MNSYLVGYELKKTRNLARLNEQMQLWGAIRLRPTLWLVEVGGLSEFEPRAETIPPLGRSDRPRTHRLFRVGLAVILAGLLCGEVRIGRFQPEPWPDPVPIPPITEELFCSQMTYP